MIVAVDAAQLEWRVAIELSRDPVGIREILDKLDFHALNQKTFNLGEGDKGRLIAKIYLFRTIFRGSAYAFSKDPDFMGVSTNVKFWEDVGEKFFRKYAGLDRWHKYLAGLCARRQPYVAFTGRSWLSEPKDTGDLPWSDFTNHPVQGTGNDLVKIARIGIYKRLKENRMESVIINSIHDSIELDSPDKEVDDACRICLEAFDDIPRMVKQYFNHELSIPFPGECKVGPNSGQLTKLKK
jgi:DNA polymerase-1